MDSSSGTVSSNKPHLLDLVLLSVLYHSNRKVFDSVVMCLRLLCDLKSLLYTGMRLSLLFHGDTRHVVLGPTLSLI